VTIRRLLVTLCAALLAATVSAQDKHPGEYLNVIHTDYETPHVTWAKPYAGGPLRALFIVPRRQAARDVVELRQRMDLDFEAVVTFNSHAVGADNRYDARVEGTSSKEKAEELRAKLKRDYDVIVIANFDFDGLPTEFQYEILRKVVDGAGLVFTYLRPTDLNLFRKPIEGVAEQLCDGVPFSGLPWWPETFMADRELESVNDIPGKLISTWQLGEGRMAVVDWGPPPATGYGGPGMTPQLDFAPELPTYYDYYDSLLARVLCWASHVKEPRIRLSGLGCDAVKVARAETAQTKVQFTAENLGKAAVTTTLKYLLRAPDGLELASGQQRLSLKPGANQLSVPLPAGLPYGSCFLDLRMYSGRAVEAWASKHIVVDSPVHVADFGLAREIVAPGGTLQGTLALSAPAPEGCSIVFTVADTTGRIFLRKTATVAQSMTEVEYELSLAGLTTQAGYLHAELREGEVTVHRAYVPVFAPHRRPEGYVNLIWGPGEGKGLGHYQLQMVRDAGFNTSLQHPTETRARNLCLHDFYYVPYSWRICGSVNDEGVRVAGFGPKTDDDSFANPAYRDACRDAILERLGPTADYRPLAYSLGDENNFAHASGFSPDDVRAFREYLKGQYADVAALNASWGTDLTSWEDLEPALIREAMADKGFAARHDHMAFVEGQYAEFHRFLRSVIRSVDPEAWVGAEGSQPGDLEKSIQDLELWSPYYRRRQDLLLEAIAPKSLIRGNWWGGYVASHGGRVRTPLTFDQLLRGLNTNFWFAAGTSSEGLTATGFGYAEYFKRLLPAMREIMGGVGKLLTEADSVFDGVGIHWSQASEHACGFDARFGSARNSHEALIAVLERLVINPTYVTTKHVEAGDLIKRGFKIIFLPTSLAISDAEAAALEAFVRQGGIVVADLGVGLMDGHCKPLEHGQLDALLGVKTTPDDPAETEGHVRYSPTFEPTEAEVIRDAEGVPVVTRRTLGSGSALALNCGLGQMLSGDPAEAEAFIRPLLGAAGVQPTVKRTPAPNWHVRLLRSGKMKILGIWRTQGEEAPPKVTLPQDYFAFDVRAGKALGATHLIQPRASEEDVFIYSLFERDPRPIRVRAPATAECGAPLAVRVEVPDAGGGRVVRLEVFPRSAPDGQAVKQLTQVFVMDDDDVTREMYPAFNDPRGAWTVRATDIATGMTAEAQVAVAGEPEA